MESLDILEAQVMKHKFLQSMTRKSFYLEYQGFGRVDSRCKVHVFNKGEYNFVFFEDIGEGTSVTNASEHIASVLLNVYNFDVDKTAWFECYPYNEKDFDIDRIHYDVDGSFCSNPVWSPVSDAIFLKFFRNEILRN